MTVLGSHGRKKAHTQFINQPDLCPSSCGQTPNDPTWSTLWRLPPTSGGLLLKCYKPTHIVSSQCRTYWAVGERNKVGVTLHCIQVTPSFFCRDILNNMFLLDSPWPKIKQQRNWKKQHRLNVNVLTDIKPSVSDFGECQNSRHPGGREFLPGWKNTESR